MRSATGSAPMLRSIFATHVILGHSERRAAQNEQDHDVLTKAESAHKAGLKVIICVGETLAERDAGNALNIVLGQVAGSLPEDISGDWLSVAYEPVWAIGTGRIPEMADVREMHGAIRSALVYRYGMVGNSVRILYGGSMNGDNAGELLTVVNVDGGLIGGASLTCAKFGPILAAAQAFSE